MIETTWIVMGADWDSYELPVIVAGYADQMSAQLHAANLNRQARIADCGYFEWFAQEAPMGDSLTFTDLTGLGIVKN